MNAIATLPALSNADAKLGRISRASVTALAVALVAVIGWFDYVTGDFSLAVFYLVAGGHRHLVCRPCERVVHWAAERRRVARRRPGAEPADGHPLMPYWNAAMLALIYGIVVQLLSALHRLQAELEERVEQRTASLAKAKAELDAARMHFIEADKLESIGRLAAGVAHEVKNPLMTITMVADYLAEVVPPTEPDGAAMIQDLREAVERANRVISEMLEFARPGALSLQPEDFHLSPSARWAS